MGSFNVQCALSDMNIQWGEPIQLIRLKKAEYPDEHYYNAQWDADCFPVAAKYDDYGYYRDLEEKAVNIAFAPLVGDDRDDSIFMAIHKSIYDKFSAKIYNADDTLIGKIWDRDDTKSKFHDKLPTEEWFKHKIDTAIEKWQMWNSFVTKDEVAMDPYDLEDVFRYMPLKDNVSNVLKEHGVEYFQNPELHKEMLAWNNFIANMNILNKKLRPSSYASQEDRIHIYGEFIDAMQYVQERKDYKQYLEDSA